MFLKLLKLRRGHRRLTVSQSNCCDFSISLVSHSVSTKLSECDILIEMRNISQNAVMFAVSFSVLQCVPQTDVIAQSPWCLTVSLKRL